MYYYIVLFFVFCLLNFSLSCFNSSKINCSVVGSGSFSSSIGCFLAFLYSIAFLIANIIKSARNINNETITKLINAAKNLPIYIPLISHLAISPLPLQTLAIAA